MASIDTISMDTVSIDTVSTWTLMFIHRAPFLFSSNLYTLCFSDIDFYFFLSLNAFEVDVVILQGSS